MTTMRKASIFATAALGILGVASVASATFTAVGPVNRATPFAPTGAPFITGPATFDSTFPLGYPLWYQDASGLRLTITMPPQGISEPGPPPLNAGAEVFYWTASATIPNWTPNPADPARPLDAFIEFAMEGANFAVPLADGGQQAFTRMRIRINTPVTGTYTVIHPYGSQAFTVTDAAAGINFTGDVGGANPLNPDSAFDGALAHPVVGPNFLTWNTFNSDPALNDPQLRAANPANPTVPFQFVGITGIPHAIGAGPNGVDFTIEGPATATTNLWDVSGKLFPAPIPIPPPAAGNRTVVPANSLLLP